MIDHCVYNGKRRRGPLLLRQKSTDMEGDGGEAQTMVKLGEKVL